MLAACLLRLSRARLVAALCLALAEPAWGATYYVSASAGADTNDGLSAGSAFKTLARVNALALNPGDSVLLRCGDVWRAEILRVTRSGAAGQPITYGSFPAADCANRPVLAGTQPITGWVPFSGSIWVADLAAGTNAPLFPNGVNQLFRDGQRLRLGRWPNLGQGDQGDGYSTIDSQPSGTQIVDAQLPAGNWAGATAHVKGMRWYILNRSVTGSAAGSLTFNAAAGCWGGNCAGWGYFLNGHLGTLDQEGEWHYDAAARRVYLFSATNPASATLEGSVVVAGESAYMGGVILGRHLQEHVAFVTLDNLEVRGWFDNGITTPVNLECDELANVSLRHLAVRDVDGIGINLQTWVWNAPACGNGYAGWRGGRNMEISDSLIERANEYGINSRVRWSTIARNVIRDVGLVANVGTAGIGCSLTDGEGLCTEPGAGIHMSVDSDGLYGSNNVTVELNRLERLGANGIGAYGYQNVLRRNVIDGACLSKGDCGGIGLFGGNSLAGTALHDVTIQENVILNVLGNTDGCPAAYRPLFGFGIYVDHYSRDILSSGNAVARATAAGILYQDSTGTIQGNTLLGNSAGTGYSHQIALTSDATTSVPALTGNVMVGLSQNAGTLRVRDAAQLGLSNQNGFYHASRATHIGVSALGDRSLAQWRAYSGHDASSSERVHASLVRSRLLVNAQATPASLPMSGAWRDLAGNPMGATLDLAAFAARVLIQRARGDFGSDDRADVAVYHAASGLWFLRDSTSGTTTSLGYGGSGYAPVAGDYDGDARADVAVFHAASGLWFLRSSATGATSSVGYGGPGYSPVPADYDGDGRTDVAAYHPPSGSWFLRLSSTGATTALGYGGSGYTPVPADYDGDQRADVAVFHAASGLWFLRSSATGATTTQAFGGPGFTPLPADWDGDGRADLVAYHATSGAWYVRSSATGTTTTVVFGGAGYTPVRPSDYDGDGRADLAVFHEATGLWFIRSAATGATSSLAYGGTGYTPVTDER